MASVTNNLMESDDDYIPPVKLKKTTNDVRIKIKSFIDELLISFLG
jgi:hypothetical protein